MTSMVLSVVVAVLLAAVATAGLLAVTLAPYVTTVNLAERHGYGPVRWAVASVASVLVGLTGLAVGLRADLALGVLAGAAAATWAAPVALVLLGGAPGRLAGARGRHEPGRPDVEI